MAKKPVKKEDKVVLTVRIDSDLDDSINLVRDNLRISKADLIRSYLNLTNYLQIRAGEIKTSDNIDFIFLSRNIFTECINTIDELGQVKIGEKLANFVIGIARNRNEQENLDFKLDICDTLGFFPKYIDAEDYIYIVHEFGPQKFAEAFIWYLIRQEKYPFLESDMANNKKLRSRYNEEVIVKPERSARNYTFEFAKLKKE